MAIIQLHLCCGHHPATPTLWLSSSFIFILAIIQLHLHFSYHPAISVLWLSSSYICPVLGMCYLPKVLNELSPYCHHEQGYIACWQGRRFQNMGEYIFFCVHVVDDVIFHTDDFVQGLFAPAESAACSVSSPAWIIPRVYTSIFTSTIRVKSAESAPQSFF